MPHRRRSLSTPHGPRTWCAACTSSDRKYGSPSLLICICGSLCPELRLPGWSHIAGRIPALAKTVWIFQRQHVGEGDQRSHSLDLLQPLGLWISVLRHGFKHLVVL